MWGVKRYVRGCMKRYMQGNEDEEFMGGGKYVGDCDCKRIVGLVNGVCWKRSPRSLSPPTHR